MPHTITTVSPYVYITDHHTETTTTTIEWRRRMARAQHARRGDRGDDEVKACEIAKGENGPGKGGVLVPRFGATHRPRVGIGPGRFNGSYLASAPVAQQSHDGVSPLKRCTHGIDPYHIKHVFDRWVRPIIACPCENDRMPTRPAMLVPLVNWHAAARLEVSSAVLVAS